MQVALHLQSKWRTRVWYGEYLASLKKRLQQDLEERLQNNRCEGLKDYRGVRARCFLIGKTAEGKILLGGKLFCCRPMSSSMAAT